MKLIERIQSLKKVDREEAAKMFEAIAATIRNKDTIINLQSSNIFERDLKYTRNEGEIKLTIAMCEDQKQVGFDIYFEIFE